MEWIIGIAIVGILVYVYNSGKKAERWLNQKWVVCFKGMNTGEEISKIVEEWCAVRTLGFPDSASLHPSRLQLLSAGRVSTSPLDLNR
jgi:hypothetical protein